MNLRQKYLCSLLIGALAWLDSTAGWAQVAKQTHDSLSSLAFRSDRVTPSQPIEPLSDELSAVAAATQSGWTTFRQGTATEWSASVDKRNGFIAFAEGGNIAWVPGRGNSLTLNNLGAVLKPGSKTVDLAALEAITRAYLPKVAAMMGVDPKSLVLNLGRSGQPAGHVWFVDFDIVQGGLVVEGARVVFRVNNGNLIQFGSENLPAPGTVVPPVNWTREQALAAVAKYIGGFSSTDTFSDSGSLHLVPVNVASTRSADGFDFGNGRGLAKVWQLTFKRDGVMGTWQARVDATSGEVLELADVNRYAQATGGVFQSSPATGGEIVRPMPYADLSTGGFTNSAGLFTGGPLSSTLAGEYVKITDTCGAISLATNGSGDLVFGTSAGTDCTTPGVGGAGNTHASRQQFYQVNRIKEVGRGWLPGNVWLGQQLTVNVNLPFVCNAYWNGSTLNFFKSGGGCGDTGEIAGVSLHEYGHGLDQNDGGGFSTDGGESYADVTAVIALHDSCIGPGFYQSGTCGSYGDACTSCSGVRDVDYAKHVSNTPATVANFDQVRCGSGGGGPCGGEVHCESYVSSEAVWDFANRDLPGAGTGPAWTILDRLWYLSRSTATTSFTCHTGTTYTSDGCSAGSWWKTMRAVDDDDGNLANGTPHGAALYAAFNRHGIACTTDPGASVSFSGCSAPAAPTLSATGSNNTANLSWSSSGSAVYDVFRNETGCSAGFTKVASGSSGTSYADHAVANGTTYYYQVAAFPSGNEACSSTPSSCVTVTPVLDNPPTASFTISCTGRSCTANGSASSDDHGISSYQWAWGDGQFSSVGPTASHTYTVNGTYTVTLTVTDTIGQTGSISHVVSAVDNPPTARFTITCSGLLCAADASTSSDDFGIVSYAWTWGGSGRGNFTGVQPSFTYNSPGSYTVTLVVTDTVGQTGTTSKVVPVHGNGLPFQTVGYAKADKSEFELRLYHETGTGGPLKAGIPGASGDPVAGDWNGDGIHSIGQWKSSTATFNLRNTNSTGAADYTFVFGTPGAAFKPIAGDWNGDGIDTVGLYDPSTGTFYLRNSNSAGSADVTFTFTGAASTWLPIAGDWDGDGTDTVGLYDPATSTFYLRNSNTTGGADLVFVFGAPGTGLLPEAGDWDGDGWDTIGVFNPATGLHQLRNLNNAGTADHQFTFWSTGSGDKPVAGDWDGI